MLAEPALINSQTPNLCLHGGLLACLRVCCMCAPLVAACHRMGKGSLSDALLLHLRDRCPRLSSLHLTHADIARFPTASLPARLSTLSITHSYLRLGWFRNAPLGALQHLDLSDSRVFDSDLADICSVTVGLRSLRLDGCYRLTDGGLQTVARRLPQLASLHLADVTRTTDLALHHVGRHLGELRHLGLSGWTSLTDSGVALVTSALPLLHSLHLDRCTLLSDNVLKLLLQGSQLRFLRLSSATFTPTAIDEFRARTTCSLEIMS